MDYFIMCQDSRLYNVAKPALGSLDFRKLTREQINDISVTQILYISESKHNEYPDYIEGAGMLVSEKLMRIMGKYQSDAIFKTIVLIEKKTNRQEIYYLISPPEIDCMSAETVCDRQGRVKKFVLDEDKVGYARIFHAVNYREKIIVRLDAAESILRRDPYGIWFERVTTAEREGV